MWKNESQLDLYFGFSIILVFSKLSFFAFFSQFQRCVLVISNSTHSKHLCKNCNPNLKKFKCVVIARRCTNAFELPFNKRPICLKEVNTLRTGVQYICTSISAWKTAVFSCLTNALAPPPIALESCSRAQTDWPV